MRRVWVACAATVLMAFPAGAALAAESGTLLVVPGEGTIDSPIDVVTSGACTRGVTFVVAVRGEGIDPVTSGNAVGNTELAVLEPSPYPGHHAVPLSRTLREYFTTNGVGAPTGEYDLVFACRDRLDATDLQTFTATIRIDKSGAYRALGASAKSLEAFLAETPMSTPAETGASDAPAQDAPGQDAAPGGDAPSSGGAESAGGPESAGGDMAAGSDESAAPSAAPGAEASPAVSAAAATSTAPAQDNTWRTVLIGMGVILLAGAAYMGWKARSR